MSKVSLTEIFSMLFQIRAVMFITLIFAVLFGAIWFKHFNNNAAYNVSHVIDFKFDILTDINARLENNEKLVHESNYGTYVQSYLNSIVNEKVKSSFLSTSPFQVSTGVTKIAGADYFRVRCFEVRLCVEKIENLRLELNEVLERKLNQQRINYVRKLYVNYLEYAKLEKNVLIMLFLTFSLCFFASVSTVLSLQFLYKALQDIVRNE